MVRLDSYFCLFVVIKSKEVFEILSVKACARNPIHFVGCVVCTPLYSYVGVSYCADICRCTVVHYL